MSRPVLHVTNFASRRLHRGTVYSIMAAPRRWERGAGTVEALCPRLDDLRALQAGRLEAATYRRRFEDGLSVGLGALVPGRLLVSGREVGGARFPVSDGDTVCCACARGAPCHRVWAVRWLQEAGWDVMLDGVRLSVPWGPCDYCEERPEVGCCLDWRTHE